MNARPPLPLKAWLSEQAEQSDRLRPAGQDPADDHLEQRARAESEADRAFDHTPATR